MDVNISWFEARKKVLEQKIMEQSKLQEELAGIEWAITLYYSVEKKLKKVPDSTGGRKKASGLKKDVLDHVRRNSGITRDVIYTQIKDLYPDKDEKKLKRDISVILSDAKSDGVISAKEGGVRREGYVWMWIKKEAA